MKGVQFVVDEKGRKTGVVIDLREWAKLWESSYDTALARSRRHEPREPLESIRRRMRRDAKRTGQAPA